MKTLNLLKNFARRIHKDQSGAVSLETILIIGAIALPVLIFIIKFGWPKVREQFDSGVQGLKSESDKVTNGQ